LGDSVALDVVIVVAALDVVIVLASATTVPEREPGV